MKTKNNDIWIKFDLSTERGFEDHENLVEPLSTWTRDTENKVFFLEKKDKYEVFRNPQASIWTAICASCQCNLNYSLWKYKKKNTKALKNS